jgi:DNA polymerase III subunit delta'
MARPIAPKPQETSPESDRFEDAPHPRENHNFFGHGETERALLLSYLSGHLPQAFIIGGPPGIGKATLAWRLARFLLANPDPATAAGEAKADLFVPRAHPVSHQITAMAHPDLILLRREWNPDTKKHFTQIQVEDVRRAIHLFQQAAGRGGYRICILDCAEDLNQNSANALLKLIEEPPSRSLFLIVAHRPGQLLATLRSRCQKVNLKPLAAADLHRIVGALGPPWSGVSETILEAAIGRAQGSVHNVLRLLDSQGIALDGDLGRMLNDLPHINWSQVHTLADRVTARNNGRDYEIMLAMIEDWLDARVQRGAQSLQGACGRRLAPYALVWEKLGEAAREAEIFNLDKRPVVLSLFADLVAAIEASSS